MCLYYNKQCYILTYPIIKTEELDSTLNPRLIYICKKFNLL